MKTFNSFESAFKWAESVVKKTTLIYISAIAEQVYKDSDKYTFRDTGEMYDSGVMSNFAGGFVTLHAPQVKFLYYATNVNAGDGNRMAIPQWFEQTKIENMKTYKQMYGKILDQQKG